MPQMTSGKVLREARERKGYDLNTVARRLRIRPDILRAIEAGDFSAMPPRGYTRNMVNAYARLLGLNPTEIVNMYLDEAYAHQVEKARGSARGSGFVMDSDHRRPRLRSQAGRGAKSEAAPDATTSIGHVGVMHDEPAPGRTGMRRLYDDRTRYSRDDYGVTRDRVERPGRSDRDFLSHHSGYSTAEIGPYDRNAPRRGFRGDIRVGQTPMHYSASRIPSFLQTRLFLGIAALAVLVIIVALVVFVLGNRNTAAEDDVSQLPVSGITDTTGTNEQQEAEDAQVEVAPTSSRVVYTVAPGDDCYVETSTDGASAIGEMLSGPAQRSVEVTGTWTIATWSPDTLKLTVDGEDVTLTSNPELSGMYSYSVDFAKMLAEWKSTHNSRDSQRQAAVATASNAASQAARESAEEESASSSGAAGQPTGATGSAENGEGAAGAWGTSASTQSYDTSGYGATGYYADDFASDGTSYYTDGTTYGDGSYYGADSYSDAGSYYDDGTSYGQNSTYADTTYADGTSYADGYYGADGTSYADGGYSAYDSSSYYDSATSAADTQGYYSEY